MHHPYYVLSGGPGSGKTSVLIELNNQGFQTIQESGRDLLRKLIKEKGKELFHANPSYFRDEMFAQDLNSYKKAIKNKKVTFFDRGIIDSLGYSKLMRIPIPDEMKEVVKTYRYNEKVFLFPPWEEIYRNDEERKQTFEEALATYHNIEGEYKRFGYKCQR